MLVLGLLAITFALSYAMMRSQVTTLHIQRNANRGRAARQAALAGLNIALRRIHEPNWAGIGVPLLQDLNDTDSFQVTFSTGDPRLSATDADYSEYPYRLTIHSTGTARDPGNPAVIATYSTRAIVQLVRRAITTPPPNWAHLQPYTLVQWGTQSGQDPIVELPVCIEGPVRFQRKLRLAESYPGNGPTQPFHGQIDEVAVFNRALSNAEIEAIYNTATQAQGVAAAYATAAPQFWWRLQESAGSKLLGDQAGGSMGTFQGATPGSTGPPIAVENLAADFDGLNDHAHLGCPNVSGIAMTILAWFRADDFNTERGRIVAKATDADLSGSYWVLSTYRSGSSNRLRFRLRTAGFPSELIASSGNLVPGQWTFAAAVYDGLQMKLFQDGIQVGSAAKFGPVVTSSQVPVYLGDCPPGSPKARILRDCRAAFLNGQSKVRPFDGPVALPLTSTSTENVSLLRDDLGVAVEEVGASLGPPVSHPGSLSTYRLYPGGASYTVPLLPAHLSDTLIGPDVLTNPLGVYRRSGALQIGNNVTIAGTLIADTGSQGVRFTGRNIRWSPTVLPPLDGTSQRVQLPATIASNRIQMTGSAELDLQGLMIAWQGFETDTRNADFNLRLRGKLFAAGVVVRGHQSWDRSETWWSNRLLEFSIRPEYAAGDGSFLDWLSANHGLPVTANVSISPETEAAVYHWHDWNQPLFVPHPSDAGLRWELLDWREG